MGINVIFQIIYVTRNPRDTVITYCNHFKVLEGYTGSFETFADAFLKDECGYYTPFMQGCNSVDIIFVPERGPNHVFEF